MWPNYTRWLNTLEQRIGKIELATRYGSVGRWYYFNRICVTIVSLPVCYWRYGGQLVNEK